MFTEWSFLLLLGSVIRTLAQTVSVGWHCFGAQWLELDRVQSWHHRPWAGEGHRSKASSARPRLFMAAGSMLREGLREARGLQAGVLWGSDHL